MPFVIKLTCRASGVAWLSAANNGGVRSLAGRESADVFEKYEDANIAIHKLPQAFKGPGRTFSVEPGRLNCAAARMTRVWLRATSVSVPFFAVTMKNQDRLVWVLVLALAILNRTR
jgi:hypothetical protein